MLREPAVRASRLRSVVERVVIGVFIAVIALPLAGRALPLERAFAFSENRRPAPFPEIELRGWSLVSFPRRFERYWNDTFGFRRMLIRWHSLAKMSLGVSPSPKALVGKSGFLFYSADRSLEYHRAVKPFTPAGIVRWQRDLESRDAWLQARGIRYLVVVAPNKETIYPEFMPDAYRPARPESRLDQLLAHLRQHSRLQILDLRGTLREAKLRGRVYHRTDTHWNDAGAFVAYGEMLRRLRLWFPEMNAEPLPADAVVRTTSGGDLARLLALEDRFPEEHIDLIPRAPRRARPAAVREPGASDPGDLSATECPVCGGPRVVMLHDSFNTNVAPLLSEHFTRIVYAAGTRLDQRFIEAERPAVVIQEFVERVLMCEDLRTC